MRPVAGATAPASLWILDPWRDLALVVGAPAIILPALWIAASRFTPDQIYLFVASFGAVGHHLPGMMRAYGDCDLFARFKYRFLAAPLFLAGTCVLFVVRDLNAIVLIAYLWGVWHGLMQTYGFLRIYDAKVGAVAKRTARIDLAMCLTWFGAAVLLSPTRMGKVLGDYYRAGGAAIAPSVVETITSLWLAATIAATVAFAAHTALESRRGRAPNPAKLALLVVSIAFWWYSNVAVSNMLVGIALFEVFHDVQYLTIVWIFNVNRVERNPGIGRFTRFLFRRSWALGGLYLGLIGAYGALNLLPAGVSNPAIGRALTGLLTASALLHFYYDGFIWKVREPVVRESLGVAGSRAPARPPAPQPVGSTGWAHGLKWAAFVVPAAWLGTAQLQGTLPPLERDRLIAAAVPNSAQARNNLGGALLVAGRVDEALPHLEAAVRLDPAHAEAHSNLGVALARRGRVDDAIEHYRAALRLDARQTQAYSNLGNAYLQQGKVREAIAWFEQALTLAPGDPQARTNLAGALLRDGRATDAIAALEEVLRTTPDFQPARRNLEIIKSSNRVIE
jgi:Flp pilus assembly protein TadD